MLGSYFLVLGGHRAEIRQAWHDLCRAANIKGVRVHDLRHSFASQLASSGFSLPVIGALLGHSQPATTARYAHLFDEVTRQATERVGAAIAGNGKPSAEIVPHRKMMRRKGPHHGKQIGCRCSSFAAGMAGSASTGTSPSSTGRSGLCCCLL